MKELRHDEIRRAVRETHGREAQSPAMRCMSSSRRLGDLENILRAGGFAEVGIQPRNESTSFIRNRAPGQDIEDFVVLANIEAVKTA
jgi:hypothetical protein